MLLSVAGMAYAVLSSSHQSPTATFYIHCAALAMFGLAGGIMNGPAQALLADSLTAGTRAKFYNIVFVLYMLASTVGPLVCIILFSVWDGYLNHSEAWPIGKLKIVLLVGLALEIPCGLIMFLFEDKRSLGKESESVLAADKGSTGMGTNSKSTETRRCNDSSDELHSEADENEEVAPTGEGEVEEDDVDLSDLQHR
jgi:MFS family permease